MTIATRHRLNTVYAALDQSESLLANACVLARQHPTEFDALALESLRHLIGERRDEVLGRLEAEELEATTMTTGR